MSTEELLKSLRERQRIQTFPDMHKEPLWEKAADEIERLIVDRDEWKEITHQSTTTTRRQP